MSRYSRIFLRPTDNGHPFRITESNSKISTLEPKSATSPIFSNSPSSLPSYPTGSPMNSPTPHPYTLGALHSAAESLGATSTPGNTQHSTEASEFSAERLPQGTVGHQYPQPLGRFGSCRERPLPLHLRPSVLLLIFLPIPPLLSLAYMVIGHVCLRVVHPSPDSIFRAPILSSVEVGATGGGILSLPLILLLYVLLFPKKPPTVSEDFFEDDDSIMGKQARWLRFTGYTVCVILVVTIGGVAGPLGATCLSNGRLHIFVEDKKMLSAGAAAAAGFLGAAIMSLGTFAIGVAGFLFCTFWIRQGKS